MRAMSALPLICYGWGSVTKQSAANDLTTQIGSESPLWVESGSRAPAIVYCASVSPNLRCVSAKPSFPLGIVAKY
jgi:hypothetical protein